MSQISKKAVAALVFISMAATFVTPMARAQTRASTFPDLLPSVAAGGLSNAAAGDLPK